MTKEEAIKHLHTYSSINGSGLTTQNQHEEAKKMAIKALETQLQWILCSEMLPEEAGTYLCTCADAGRLMVTVIKWQPRMRSWNLTGARAYWKVVAWMPLPDPWKGAENG